MPRIEEYLPQTTAEGPVGGTSPMIEEVGAYGRGVQAFGGDLTKSLDFMQRRQEQSEVSDASATFSDAREQFNQQINEQTQNGTLDSQKIADQYDSYIEKQGDRFDTPGGKNYFNRQAERLRGSLLLKASRGQAVVAGNNAKAEYQNSLTNDTNVVADDPTQFPDIHEANMEKIGALVNTGAISAAQAPMLQQDIGKKLSQAAVRGYIQADYNSAVTQAQGIIDSSGPNALPKSEALAAQINGFNTSQQMMDSGTFDSYLSSNDKKALAGELRANQSGAVAEINRLITVKKSAQQEQAQNWIDQNFAGIKTNGVSAKSVLNAPIPWQQKNELLNIMQSSTRAQTTDPLVANSLMKRITTTDNAPDKISDPAQLLPYVGKGISAQDYERYRTLIDNTPAGQALNQNRKMVVDLAKSKLVSSNPMIGTKDPDGEFQLMQFTNALQQQESKLRSQGKSVDELYDVSSPNFFGNKIGQYQKTPQQIMQQQADQARGQITPPVTTQPAPGGGQPAPKNPATSEETKTMGGVPYVKVPGGWKRAK